MYTNILTTPHLNSRLTRTTHMHDASRRAVPVRIAHADRPCGAEMSENIGSQSSIKNDHS